MVAWKETENITKSLTARGGSVPRDYERAIRIDPELRDTTADSELFNHPNQTFE
jgi:hypothetical protein